MPPKDVIIAQPGSAWKTTCIVAGAATRVTRNAEGIAVDAAAAAPNQCTSTSLEVWRYQRATDSCFSRVEGVTCCHCQAQCLQC